MVAYPHLLAHVLLSSLSKQLASTSSYTVCVLTFVDTRSGQQLLQLVFDLPSSLDRIDVPAPTLPWYPLNQAQAQAPILLSGTDRASRQLLWGFKRAVRALGSDWFLAGVVACIASTAHLPLAVDHRPLNLTYKCATSVLRLSARYLVFLPTLLNH